MARPGITYQEVAAAADSIIAAGDNPTIAKIRAELGTGSPNTIHRHLTAWRTTAPVKERKTPELPAALQEALVQEFERQAAEIRAELENTLVEAQTEASKLSEVGEQLEKDMTELRALNRNISDESQRLEALANERAKEIRKLETELTREREAAEETRIQLAQARNKVEAQEKQITAQQGRISTLEAYLDEANHVKVTAQQAAAVCEAKLESSKREIDQQTKRVEQLEKNLAGQKADFEKRLSEQVADARRREQVFEKQIKDIRDDYQQRIEELKRELTQKGKELNQTQAEAAQLRGRLEAKTEKRKETKKANKA
jgi:colicin import membrane protein